MRLPFLIALLCLASHAHAGAWMREEGSVFLSFGANIDETGRAEGAIYAEYGLRPKLTLGLKIDVAMTDGRMGDGEAYVFARKPIPVGERDFKLAYEVGLGGTLGDDASGLVRVGFNYGRGIKLWDRNGWLAIDSALEWTTGDSELTGKLDSTLGLALNDRFKVMVQVFYIHTDAENSTTIGPSLIWTPKKDAANSYHIGLESDDGVLGVKLGVWRSF